MQVRSLLVKDNRVEPFLSLASEEFIDYKRTAAVAFASFSLNEENRPKVRAFYHPFILEAGMLIACHVRRVCVGVQLVRTGALRQMIESASLDDLEVQRDTAFALANISDSLDLQVGPITQSSRIPGTQPLKGAFKHLPLSKNWGSQKRGGGRDYLSHSMWLFRAVCRWTWCASVASRR